MQVAGIKSRVTEIASWKIRRMLCLSLMSTLLRTWRGIPRSNEHAEAEWAGGGLDRQEEWGDAAKDLIN
jgi:hypothetical protein